MKNLFIYLSNYTINEPCWWISGIGPFWHPIVRYQVDHKQETALQISVGSSRPPLSWVLAHQICHGHPRFLPKGWGGGGKHIFVCKACGKLGGFRGMLPREILILDLGLFLHKPFIVSLNLLMWNRILSGKANQSQGRANALFLENVLSRCLVCVYPVPGSLLVCPLTCLSTRASRQTWSGSLDFAACPFALPMTPNQSKTKWKTSTTSWLRPPPLSRHFLSSWETSGIR